jgi:hypothetical protein
MVGNRIETKPLQDLPVVRIADESAKGFHNQEQKQGMVNVVQVSCVMAPKGIEDAHDIGVDDQLGDL